MSYDTIENLNLDNLINFDDLEEKEYKCEMTYDILNELLKEMKIDIFFHSCKLVKQKNQKYLDVFINSLIEQNIKDYNFEFIKILCANIYEMKFVSFLIVYLEKYLNPNELQDLDIIKQFIDNPNNKDDLNSVFIKYCHSGNTKIISLIWIIANDLKSPIDIHMQEEQPFRECCINGHIDAAKWLFGLSNKLKSQINIRANKDEAFFKSSEKKYYDIVGWLCSLCSSYKIRITMDNNVCYESSLISLFEKYDIKNNLEEKLNFVKIGTREKYLRNYIYRILGNYDCRCKELGYSGESCCPGCIRGCNYCYINCYCEKKVDNLCLFCKIVDAMKNYYYYKKNGIEYLKLYDDPLYYRNGMLIFW
jgi:hypothetical protein